MSMGKRAPHDWDEQDAFTGWRHVIRFGRGARSKIKRRARRRERHEARLNARRQH